MLLHTVKVIYLKWDLYTGVALIKAVNPHIHVTVTVGLQQTAERLFGNWTF